MTYVMIHRSKDGYVAFSAWLPLVVLGAANAANGSSVAFLPSSLWHGDRGSSVWMHVLNGIGRQFYWDSGVNSLRIRS
ncbi:hypothetical protein RUE5091_01826 [Ruegeria denitrificans]|uniref:Uncharacterized protein n=1 Tax=Ruegeria denitrificans TaxID=1715692 RepID=A0A0P1I8N0_9RHOB|nr:hypothetical protein [Ruegeria denitrificans]CUJ97613.1 hypothetical protein RUE5091_01826 [Ruegeria denitrificans]